MRIQDPEDGGGKMMSIKNVVFTRLQLDGT